MDAVEYKDLLEYQYFSALQAAPDGQSAIFCLSQADEKTNTYNVELWRCVRNNGNAVKIADTLSVRSFCLLTPESILFPVFRHDRDKQYAEQGGLLTVFEERNLKTGESREAFRVCLKNAAAYKVKRGLFLLSCIRDNSRPDIESLPEDARNSALKKWQEENEDFEVCDELPFISDGRGFINRKRDALYLYDTDKHMLLSLTDRNFECSNFAISKDGRYIAFSGVSYDRFYVRTHGIYLYDIEQKNTIVLLSPGSYQIMGLDFLGDELVVAAAPWNGIGSFPNHGLYTLSLTDGSMRLRHTHSSEDFGNKSCSDCRYGIGTSFCTNNEYLYYFTTCDTAVYINRWKPGKQPERLNDESFIPDSIAVTNDEVFATGTQNGLQELFIIDRRGKLHCISHVNTKKLMHKEVSYPHKYCFKNSTGIWISGFVIEPIEYDPSKTYPGILQIHGGPRNAFTATFFHEMQCLAGKGYFIFFCNPRGSAGKGEDFANISARRGTIDYTDLMEWTDFVLNMYPAIDPERLGVMGGSYGGYMTNWCITHTNRFHAAVSMRSISNITSDYGATDFGIWGTPGVYGGTPWCRESLLTMQSPYTYAMNVTTPTLFLHSFEDYRCTVSGAMQMYSALQLKGIPTRMCLFRHSCHELSRSGMPRSRIRRLKEIFEWFDYYLKEK